MTDLFKLNNKDYQLENIYCFIDINNIENYLKRIENVEKEYNNKINIIIIKNTNIFNKEQINWAVFNAKNRFSDKINISKNLITETLMILSFSNQIKGISNDFLLTKDKKEYFVIILSEKKINCNQILKKLEIEKIKTKPKINLKQIKEFYRIKNYANIENQIIEKMTLSLYK